MTYKFSGRVANLRRDLGQEVPEDSVVIPFKAKPEIPAEEWPNTRQLALMFLRRTVLVKPVTQILQRSTVKPTRYDWNWLRTHCLITRHETTRNLICTQQGGVIADRLAWHHARELGLHLFKEAGGDSYNVGLACSCGHFFINLNKNQGHIQSQIYAAQGRHLHDVEQPGYKPPRPIGEILDEVIRRVQDSS